LLELSSFLLHFIVKVAANGLVCPRLLIEVGASLLFRVAAQVEHGLEIVGLRDEPFVDEILRIFREAHEEVAVHAQLIYLLDKLVDFRVQLADLGERLRLGRVEEALHLITYGVVDFHVDIVNGRTLGIVDFNTFKNEIRPYETYKKVLRRAKSTKVKGMLT
jgi:hypothetical protein